MVRLRATYENTTFGPGKFRKKGLHLEFHIYVDNKKSKLLCVFIWSFKLFEYVIINDFVIILNKIEEKKTVFKLEAL